MAKTVRLLMVALVVLLATVASCSIRRQLLRDRECTAHMRQAAQRIEMYRAQHGRLPRKEELSSIGVYALRFSTKRDARGDDVYHFSVWRGEWAVEYDSASGEDSCDSEAWKAGAWLAGAVLPLLTVTLWLGVRNRRGVQGA